MLHQWVDQLQQLFDTLFVVEIGMDAVDQHHYVKQDLQNT
jgi:hypothetical protein